MNRKEILKKSHENAKNNFWMYLAVIVLAGIVSGICSGSFDAFGKISNLMSILRSGMLSRQELMSPDSDFYRMMRAGGIMAGGFGIFRFAANAFISNPLSVGVNKYFLRSVHSETKIMTVTEPFKDNYLNTVLVMFLRDLLMTVILFGISLIYTIVAMLAVGIMFAVASLAPALSAVGIAAAYVIILAALAGYAVWSICISYNFIFIGYILTEHPYYSFTTAYNINKSIVRGKKLEIFKADFHYMKWTILAALVPVVLITVGFVQMYLGNGGIACMIAGTFLIIPVMCIFLLMEVFRSALRAHIYSSIGSAEQPQAFKEEQTGFYQTPTYHEPISYSDTQADNEQPPMQDDSRENSGDSQTDEQNNQDI